MADAITANARRVVTPRRTRRISSRTIQALITPTIAIPLNPRRDPGTGRLIARARELEAVVVTVRVTVAVVVDEVNVRVEGLKLQLLCGGRYRHSEGESVAEPAKPFCATNVSTVDPDCPGLAIAISVGLAVIEKASPTPINMGGAVDPL
jgi:hypothetical protein